MDLIYIEGLAASAIIGAYEAERHARRPLIIDLELGCNAHPAGVSDRLTQALDYDAVSRRTLEFVEASRCFLLEALAEQLAQMLLREFPVLRVKIRVSKPGAIDTAKDVGIIIERERHATDERVTRTE